MDTRLTRLATVCALLLVAVAGAVGACSDSTGPSGEDPDPDPVDTMPEPVDTVPRINVTSTTLSRSQLVLDDVSFRLIPAVANFPGTLELAAAVSALAQVVAQRNAQGVLDNVARANTALAQVRAQTTPAEAADLDAIAIGIRDAELLVTLPPSS
jgi:hypothetical protein